MFATQLACRSSGKLAGVAVVAGSLDWECPSSTAALVIHGQRDSVMSVSRGWHARDRFLTLNGCERATSRTGIAACVAHASCAPRAPVWWCEHDEPTYEDTNHGWPSFASAATATFFFERLSFPAPREQANVIANSHFERNTGGWEASLASPDIGSMASRGERCA